MTDFNKWARTGIHIDKKADIKKEEKCIKQINKLVGRYEKEYGWQLEKRISSLDSFILIKINYPAECKRCLPEIKRFRDELESILKRYDIEIEEFCDTGISSDAKSRRIDIRLKRRN